MTALVRSHGSSREFLVVFNLLSGLLLENCGSGNSIALTFAKQHVFDSQQWQRRLKVRSACNHTPIKVCNLFYMFYSNLQHSHPPQVRLWHHPTTSPIFLRLFGHSGVASFKSHCAAAIASQSPSSRPADEKSRP